jgi:hypothetical protein
MKKLLLSLIFGFALASSAKANLAGAYAWDLKNTKAHGFLNGDRSWVWMTAQTGGTLVYKFNGKNIEAGLAFAPANHMFLANNIWNTLYACAEPGEVWAQYHIDQFGNPEYRTNDGKMCAKLFWNNGLHCLRICYTTFLSANGLWRFDNVATKSKPRSPATVAAAKPKARANPKARVAPEDKPLLPRKIEADDRVPQIEFAAPEKQG